MVREVRLEVSVEATEQNPSVYGKSLGSFLEEFNTEYRAFRADLQGIFRE